MLEMIHVIFLITLMVVVAALTTALAIVSLGIPFYFLYYYFIERNKNNYVPAAIIWAICWSLSGALITVAEVFR